MFKGVAASSIVLSTALALTGCMTKQGDVGNKNIRSNNYRAQSLNGPRFANDGLNETNRINGTQRMNNNVAGLHGNTDLQLSQDIANRLSALPEIKSAFVALTNNNAYVAIVENRNAANRSGNAAMGTNNANRGNAAMGANSLNRGDGAITPHSMGATPRSGGTTDNPNHFRSHYSADGLHYYHKNHIAAVPQTGLHTRSKDGIHGLSDGGSDLGTGLGQGTAGTSGAAVADVSDDLKNKVADIVKGMHPTVDNVYVSANPDFYSRMQGLATDIGNGHPIRGMVNEFNALVSRIFPQNVATGTDNRMTNNNTNNIAPRYAPSVPARSDGFANR